MSFLGEPFRHDLFVSYSHGTFAGAHHFPLREWSRAFAADLEAQIRQILHFREANLFLDAKERPGQGVDPTEPLTEGLKQHIAGSALLVILMSPDYLGIRLVSERKGMVVAAPHAGRPWRRRASFWSAMSCPTSKSWTWSPLSDAKDWPAVLKDEDDPKFTGFWFHAQNDVDFATVPYKWEGHTKDIDDYHAEMRSLVRVITRRLSEIRQRLEERKREAEEERDLLARVAKSSTSTAVLGSWSAWRRIREALQRSNYTVLPTAPEDSLPGHSPAGPQGDSDGTHPASSADSGMRRHPDGPRRTDQEFEIDLAGIGRNDRARVRRPDWQVVAVRRPRPGGPADRGGDRTRDRALGWLPGGLGAGRGRLARAVGPRLGVGDMNAALSRRAQEPLRVARPEAPYPGLRPFEKHEWTIFFGRERMINDVIDQLANKQLVVVHGDLGCGKSSLIRAGVLAQLELDHSSKWIVLAHIRNAPRGRRRLTDLRRRWPTWMPERSTELLEEIQACSISVVVQPPELAKLLRHDPRDEPLHPGRSVRGAVQLR